MNLIVFHNEMKAKLITSILFGILIPWLYFVFVNVGPIRYYDVDGDDIIGASGIAGFIEFNGITDSILIYLQAILVCTLLVLFVCGAYDFIQKKLKVSRPTDR